MTAGKLLKKNLGLENFKNVRINTAKGFSIKTLFVWYDSYRPTMPLTNYRIRRFPWVATLFVGADVAHGPKRNAIFTPPIDIEDYNGEIRNAMIIPVNLAGDKFIKAKQYSKKFESIEKVNDDSIIEKGIFIGSKILKEFITLYDLKDKSNISDFTITWWRDRNRIMKGASQNIKLVDLVIDEADKSVTFQFLTEATRLGDKSANDNIDSSYRFYSGPKGETEPEDNWNIKRNRSEVYEIQIKILEFFDWLDTFEGEKIGRKEMKEILEVSNVQMSSTSPSFNWQGFAYWLSQLDACIYPQNIKPKVWNNTHGDGQAFLDKHTYSLLQGISFFLNQMAVKLTSKLKSRGLI